MKMFQKEKTLKALEGAKLNLVDKIDLLKKAEQIRNEINTRAARKAVRRAEIDVESAYARVTHIEIALGYQSEKHDAKIRKPAVGEILVKPDDKEKEAMEVVKKIREKQEANANHSMADAMERYESQCRWETKKAEQEERRRIRAEAKKAVEEEARKIKAILADAEKAAKKAEQIAKTAEKAEAEKSIALAVTPIEAMKLIEELENYKSLISAIIDNVHEIEQNRDEFRAKARELKARLFEMEGTLKEPMKSSKYRALLLEKKEIEEKISVNVKMRGALMRKGSAMLNEKKALDHRITVIKKNGNSATRPTIRSYISELRKNKVLVDGVRELETVVERVKKDSFQIPGWDAESVIVSAGLKDLFDAANEYKTGMKNTKESQLKFENSMKAVARLMEIVEKKEPIRLHAKDSRPLRIQENMYSMCMKIDTEDPAIRHEWINVEHRFNTSLNPSWKLFSTKKADGEKKVREFKEMIHELLAHVEVTWWNGKTTTYDALYASASHQKKEKLVLCDTELMDAHELLVYFGMTKAEFCKKDITGAELWKMRANFARPIAFAITTKDGEPVYLRHIYMVPDQKKTYHHENALFIGGNHNGKLWELGEGDNDVIVGDGASTSKEEMCVNAFQGGGAGVKFMYVNGKDAFDYVEQKDGQKPEMPAGKLIVCGDGCFKLDKLYDSFEEYAAKMDKLAEKYPGINQVYALRQSEEVEGEDKIRRVSRSLLQQLFIGGDDEMYKLAEQTVNNLLYKKTFEGLFASLAELGISIDKRSEFAKLILECPELLTNINVQLIGRNAWECKQADAIGNKLRTKGQYPYIMQDLVALIEIWLLHKDVNDPDLGVLKAGEVSVVGVKEGVEMVMIRYPANFLTAKTVICKPLKEIFGNCGNVAIISIHDDVLIIQDGDVDGDEAGFFYDKILVKLVNKMRRIINPPVVVFEHGSKAKREVIEEEAARLTAEAEAKAKRDGKNVWKVYKPEDILRRRMFSALNSAKEFDSVGKYANLARDCAYLLSIDIRAKAKANREGDTVKAAKYDRDYRDHLLWMAAASTGAILAIDQVKGNAIDPKLIEWLDTIEKNVKELLVKPVEIERDGKKVTVNKYFAPFTQPYVKGDFSIETLDPNPQVGTDNLGYNVLMATGKWEHNAQEFIENKQMLAQAILDHRHPHTTVHSGYVTSGLLTELRPNYFNRSFKGRNGQMINPDEKILNLISNNMPVGQKDLLLLFYRNMHTLEFRMQEKTVPGKRRAYYAMVRRCIIDHALSTKWFATEYTKNYECGHEFTDEEKKTAVINAAIIDALELGAKGNGLPQEDKGSYAKFILSVFAEDIRDNVRRNNVDIRHFMMENCGDDFVVDAEYEETDFDALDELNDEYVPDDSCNIDVEPEAYVPSAEEEEEAFRMLVEQYAC